MHRRLIILSAIILAALCGLVFLGYHSIQIWAQGIEGTRLGEFAAVAEQIRQDVKRKLDEFMEKEQNRPYTDYQYYYVAENVAPGQEQMPLLRSPLGGRLEHGLAYGNFQIEPDGSIITPNDDIERKKDAADVNNELYAKVLLNKSNVENNLLPTLNIAAPGSFRINNINKEAGVSSGPSPKEFKLAELAVNESLQKKGGKTKVFSGKREKALPIKSLQSRDQKAQVFRQQRSVAASNVAQSVEPARQQGASVRHREQPQREMLEQIEGFAEIPERESLYLNKEIPGTQSDDKSGQLQRMDNVQTRRELQAAGQAARYGTAQGDRRPEPSQTPIEQTQETTRPYDRQKAPMEEDQTEMVEVRVGPFETMVTRGGNAEKSISGGQVFLLRHVQIEDRHFWQGFQLNETELIKEVQKSAKRFMREGMSFELAQTKNEDAAYATTENEDIAYTAILDFLFGDLILHLKETDPAWIGKQINQLRNWYLSIIAVVLFAVTLGLASLWRNARAQLKLAQKKDDFISAVSHELRTPLTSIRMYSEMLEKNWVKSEDKLAEYYRNMRQESERLSRLIENVLDFSRIQRGRKKYMFNLGDINNCIAEVVKMMSPYAAQNGFSIKTQFGELGQTAFDGDAVTQIVVNLLDNAIKYARNAQDKTITVRTQGDDSFILIEVEDHGPGVPHRQRKKIFQEFYRSGAEATRETTGTGLGLALVKKFAQAHNGFVEIISAKPTGTIFRVGLAAQI